VASLTLFYASLRTILSFHCLDGLLCSCPVILMAIEREESALFGVYIIMLVMADIGLQWLYLSVYTTELTSFWPVSACSAIRHGTI
jgi:hypothetical protein